MAQNQRMTPEQKAENERAIADTHELMDCIQQGISPCCHAPLDMRDVITSGRYKGHGKRFCSKCKKWVFTV